mmetsp:Transcript_12276/g.35140  ORF Transcript_12276/g.35140 Transcript_12276/m.35140 type:complete len:85 (+) Transcript_12276:393-647(+)
MAVLATTSSSPKAAVANSSIDISLRESSEPVGPESIAAGPNRRRADTSRITLASSTHTTYHPIHACITSPTKHRNRHRCQVVVP